MKSELHATASEMIAGADDSPRGKVIALRPPDDARAPHRGPQLTLVASDRPAPPQAPAEMRIQFVLIFVSVLLLHAAFFAFLQQQPETVASVGEDAIIVEIVVGADAAA